MRNINAKGAWAVGVSLSPCCSPWSGLPPDILFSKIITFHHLTLLAELSLNCKGICFHLWWLTSAPGVQASLLRFIWHFKSWPQPYHPNLSPQYHPCGVVRKTMQAPGDGHSGQSRSLSVLISSNFTVLATTSHLQVAFNCITCLFHRCYGGFHHLKCSCKLSFVPKCWALHWSGLWDGPGCFPGCYHRFGSSFFHPVY